MKLERQCIGQQLVVPGQAHTMHVEGLSAANVPPAVIEVLCRGGSFPCVPPGLSELGECAAGRFWTAYGRQLPGAREGAEVIQAADGGASGPRLVAPAETAQGSQESGAGSEVATWPPAPGWGLVPRLVLVTNVLAGGPSCNVPAVDEMRRNSANTFLYKCASLFSEI